ncbi:oligosaccharyl transferase, archaeosortase A system-associated [Chloroflexota bacterium]
MSTSKINPKFIAAIIMALFFAVAICLRVCLLHETVFGGEFIKFTSGDAYHHMRLVDNLLYNFPNHTSIDPFFLYPGASGPVTLNFFGWFLAISSWIVGLGSPTQHTIDVVGAYLPAILGSLTIIPVYFIGKELFSRWAGLLAAGILAILPGEIMGRSILGFTDYDIANVLFTTVTIMFLILAIKATRQRQLTFGHLKRREWRAFIRPAIYSLLAGIFMGMYIFTWLGALLFVFIFSAYFVIQFIIDHLKRRPTDYLCFVGVVFFAVTLVISLLISVSILYLVTIIIALLVPLLLGGISLLIARLNIKPFYYPLTVLGLGLTGWGLFYLLNPSLLNSMFDAFKIFNPAGAQLTTIEMQSLFMPLIAGGGFFTTPAWYNFYFNLLLSIAAFLILCTAAIKQGGADKTLLVVWSLVILIACWGQRRFAIYLATNIALLTGYISILIYYVIQFIVDYLRSKSTGYSWEQILELSGFRDRPASVSKEASGERDYYEVLGVSRNATDKQIRRAFRKLASEHAVDDERMQEITRAYEMLSDGRRRAAYNRSIYTIEKQGGEGASRKKGGLRFSFNQVNLALTGVIIFFVFVAPLVVFHDPDVNPEKAPTISVASGAPYAPTDGWCSSLSWLKDNSPEPLDNPDAYYGLYDLPAPGGNFEYPDSAYGVLAWWDYGYWISRIAHRIPNANPSQSPQALTSVATFFTSENETSANEIAGELGSAYVIVDDKIAYVNPRTLTSKLWAIATWAGKNPNEYSDIHYFSVELEGETRWLPYATFYPEYYRLMAVRLYNFDGEAVTPEKATVIGYEERFDDAGNLAKLVTTMEEFDTYEEAEAYIANQESPNYRIISLDPILSPVPLEALEDYELIYSSDETVTLADGSEVPEIKIFQRLD